MNLQKLVLPCGIAAATVFLLASAPANAQATRTWVSGVGDDANPCSRTAPCKTFAGAISKTAAGGEISVLDPGGFGAVTITKSISLTQDSSGEAGILASGTNGIIVNAAATDIINLRGLVIDGGTPVSPGLNGVRFLAGGVLNIQNSVIKNFTASSGFGVLMAPSNTFRLMIRDTVLSNNGNGTTGGAISIAPTGAASASVTLTRVTMDSNGNGLLASALGTTGAVLVTVLDSAASANNGTGFSLTAGNNTFTSMNLMRAASVNNTTGVLATNGNATINISESVLSGNNNAITTASGGKVVSYLSNIFNGGTIAPTSTQSGQ